MDSQTAGDRLHARLGDRPFIIEAVTPDGKAVETNYLHPRSLAYVGATAPWGDLTAGLMEWWPPAGTGWSCRLPEGPEEID